MEKAKIPVDRLAELRKEKGWSKSELARRSGISRSYISECEDGVHSPSLDAALRIAKALGCTVWSLTSTEPKMTVDIPDHTRLKLLSLCDKLDLPPQDLINRLIESRAKDLGL